MFISSQSGTSLQMTSLHICQQVYALLYNTVAPHAVFCNYERIQLHLHAHQWAENGRLHYSRCTDDEAGQTHRIRISKIENTATNKDERIWG